ncbi:MAG: thioredoxin [Candidatus Eisenbacteria bacterium]|nr:thioredoxin [Candidatus Eisenbacteria bacterium]MCC7142515.1 thioredoxin [Candidatus Eisenbacteria bacterium]
MHTINDSNYASLVESSELPVVLDFGATWCGPCKKLEPIIEELSKELEGKAIFGKVDIDAAQETAKKFGVMSVPTVIFLKGGQPVYKFAGLMPKNKIQQLLDQHLW